MLCKGVALVLAASSLPGGVEAARVVTDKEGSCNALTNEGAFSTVEVSVGTPPQKLKVVADTGSDLVLIEHCACKKGGGCEEYTRCYTGDGGKSKTYRSPDDPHKVTITYGSGPIETKVATDQVTLGSITAEMTDSLMMIQKNKLRGGIQLEGILGLGMPHNKNSLSDELGFLDRAKVERFSMCFNKDSEDGMLKLGTHKYVPMDKPLAGVGVKHWSVQLPAVSIGNSTIDAEASMTSEESAIVDSGTTLILGPEEKMIELLGRICDAWPKCQTSSSFLQGATDSSQVFKAKAKALLRKAADCEVDDMPSLHFHVRGKDGSQDVLEMTANDYMVNMSIQLKIGKNLFGSEGQPSGCKPAMDLRKSTAGAKFILGSPFYTKFNIAYDRSSKPPAISFNRAECGSCGGMASSFLASRTSVRRVLKTEPWEGLFQEE